MSSSIPSACAQGHAVLQHYIDKGWILPNSCSVYIVSNAGGSISDVRLEQGKCIATCNECWSNGPVNVQWDANTGMGNVTCSQRSK